MKNIQVLENLPESIEKLQQTDVEAYETSHGIDVNYKQFSLVSYAENGDVIGVLNAFTAYAEIYIDDMWVNSQYRGKGYGRELIQTLEVMYEGKGFNNINLCTSHFQAPDFYKKCGFTLEFVRENKVNPKLTKYFFSKMFKNTAQTQGLV